MFFTLFRPLFCDVEHTGRVLCLVPSCILFSIYRLPFKDDTSFKISLYGAELGGPVALSPLGKKDAPNTRATHTSTFILIYTYISTYVYIDKYVKMCTIECTARVVTKQKVLDRFYPSVYQR